MHRYELGDSSAKRYHVKAADTLRQPLSFISREMIAEVYAQPAGDQEQTVCFTGHRSLPQEEISALSARLDSVLETLYQQGYRKFFSGAALGFDMLAAERVVALRDKHSDVRLHLAIPCSEQSRKWREADCARYEQIAYRADSIHVLSRDYYVGCMQVRNRFMVDHSSFCLCYLTHTKGGTMSTVAYAMRQSYPVLNIAMADACEAFTRRG